MDKTNMTKVGAILLSATVVCLALCSPAAIALLVYVYPRPSPGHAEMGDAYLLLVLVLATLLVQAILVVIVIPLSLVHALPTAVKWSARAIVLSGPLVIVGGISYTFLMGKKKA